MTGVAKYFESMNGCQVNIYFGVKFHSVHAFYLLLRWKRLHIHVGFRIKFWGELSTNLWVIVGDEAVTL
jgi:hypothetical protein